MSMGVRKQLNPVNSSISKKIWSDFSGYLLTIYDGVVIKTL